MVFKISLDLHNIIFHGVFQLFSESRLINWIYVITGPSVDRDVKKVNHPTARCICDFVISIFIQQSCSQIVYYAQSFFEEEK